MRHIVLFSGGIQSSYVAYLVCRQQEHNVTFLFHDTKTEPLDNYRFRQEVSEYLGIPITAQSDGRNIWQVFDDEDFLGNNRVPICSILLKGKQGEKFYKNLNDDFIVYVGFGLNEGHRIQKIVTRNPKIKYKFPLIENKIFKDAIIKIILRQWEICLPEMYRYFKHANCIPCVRGQKKHWQQVYYHYPEAYQKAIEYENKFGYTIMPKLSLTEFKKELYLLQTDFDDDILPCLCAV